MFGIEDMIIYIYNIHIIFYDNNAIVAVMNGQRNMSLEKWR